MISPASGSLPSSIKASAHEHHVCEAEHVVVHRGGTYTHRVTVLPAEIKVITLSVLNYIGSLHVGVDNEVCNAGLMRFEIAAEGSLTNIKVNNDHLFFR